MFNRQQLESHVTLILIQGYNNIQAYPSIASEIAHSLLKSRFPDMPASIWYGKVN